ncbi:MAG: hypothetical protein ACREXK_04850 [Gammaproteobacteria bacterium]
MPRSAAPDEPGPFPKPVSRDSVTITVESIGDLTPEVRDWRNPVARVAIRRVN